MNFYQRFYHNFLLRPTSWKNAARFNCVVLVIFTFPLLVLTIFSFAKATDGSQFFMLPKWPCERVSMVNKGLHLVLNIFSSLILASSNFFMQILNAPSRSEIDRAHRRGTWLEIGVPSLRNTFRVSRFKTFFWVVLFLSSIPIHLVFNSAVFQIDTITGDYNMAVASEAFLNGAPYFLPGAGLSQPWIDEFNWAYWAGNRTTDRTGILGLPPKLDRESFETYSRNASTAIEMKLLRHPGKNWARLNAKDCYHQYADYHCSGIRTYKDVVVILNEPLGWTRNETWNLAANRTMFWDQIMPPYRKNSLWFFSNCTMHASGYAGNTCSSNCLELSHTDDPNTWIPDSADWYADIFSGESITLRLDRSRLRLSHCLAERLEQDCGIGVSTRLLLAVLICVVMKATAALIVTRKLSRQPDESLVTIGDALASFIRNPDAITLAKCTYDQKEANAIIIKPPHHIAVPRPREWCKPRKRLGSHLKWSVWTTCYTLIVFGILFAVGWLVYGSYRFGM